MTFIASREHNMPTASSDTADTSAAPAPTNLRVTPVQSGRERKLFLELPWNIYQGDDCWIPPLRQNQKEMVNYSRHPFYEENKIQTFIATADGQPVGRIAALVNYEHNRRYKENRGFVGFFVCIG